MTIKEIEKLLSLKAWLNGTVLPVAVFLVITLLLSKLIAKDAQDLDQISVILGFFSLFYILVRGGHVFMIRSMHNDLKETYRSVYEERLKDLPADMKRKNLGFSLARIKGDLIHQRK